MNQNLHVFMLKSYKNEHKYFVNSRKFFLSTHSNWNVLEKGST